MNQQAPDLEQRLSKLEAQLDRFSLTIQQWQQTQKHLQPVESRLTHLIEIVVLVIDAAHALLAVADDHLGNVIEYT